MAKTVYSLKTKIADLSESYRSILNQKIDSRQEKFLTFINEQADKLRELLAVTSNNSSNISVFDPFFFTFIKISEAKIKNLQKEIEDDLQLYENSKLRSNANSLSAMGNEIAQIMQKTNDHIQSMILLRRSEEL